MKSNMVCPECGENVYSTWNYCAHCGAALDVKEQIKDAIRELASDSSKRTSKTMFNEHSPFSSGTVIRLFGSWNDAVEAATGKRPPDRDVETLTRDEAVEKLRGLTDELGHPPSTAEANEYLDTTVDTLKAAVNASAWDDVLRAADIYACNQCSAWFETGQELGGHKGSAHGR